MSDLVRSSKTHSVPQAKRAAHLKNEVHKALRGLKDDELLIIAVSPVLGSWSSSHIAMIGSGDEEQFLSWFQELEPSINGPDYMHPPLHTRYHLMVVAKNVCDAFVASTNGIDADVLSTLKAVINQGKRDIVRQQIAKGPQKLQPHLRLINMFKWRRAAAA